MQSALSENDVSGAVIDSAIRIHQALGPGLLESAYERVLAYELRKRGFHVETQVAVPLRYEDVLIEEGFRADIIVNGTVLVELKSVEKLSPVHKKQVLTYLKLTGIRLGLLINFGEALLKDGVVRIANGMS
jgi:GxxExxY protein